MTRCRTVAVVLGGGLGTRVGLPLPKQLIRVAGKTVIEHTIAALHASEVIDEIVVMMAPGHLDAVWTIIGAGGYPKVTSVLGGGETRNATTARALDALGSEECNVLLHDAVRPLVSRRIIQDCVDALDTYDAVDTAIDSADTIIQVDGDEGRLISDVPARQQLRRGQTPQGFKLSVIRRAYERAARDLNFSATDDCTVVLRYCPDVPIAVVPGEERNLKITEPIDVFLADRLFQLESGAISPQRSYAALRQALRGRCLIVFGGSSGIGSEMAQRSQELGADVMVFSRSTTGTYVQRIDDLERARQEALAKFGRVDYVVNAAGMLTTGNLSSAGEDDIRTATDVNYLGPVNIARVFHPVLKDSRGALLYFTSSSYTRGRSGYALYSSAKAAVVNLTQALADEWVLDGIRVNCVNPERTATPMRSRAFGVEPPDSLLTARAVAETSLGVLASDWTGQVVDVRRGVSAVGGRAEDASSSLNWQAEA